MASPFAADRRARRVSVSVSKESKYQKGCGTLHDCLAVPVSSNGNLSFR